MLKDEQISNILTKANALNAVIPMLEEGIERNQLYA